MNIKDAYEIIKKYNKGKRLVECLEFDDFYAFAFCERDDNLLGGGYDTVAKMTGEISVFNPIENLNDLFRAKLISVDILEDENKLKLFYIKEQLKELLQILEEVYALEIMNTNAQKVSHIVCELRWGKEANLTDILERVKILAPYCNGEKDDIENQLEQEDAGFIHGWTYISLKSAVSKLYPIEFCEEIIPLISESYNRVVDIIADREWTDTEWV